MREQVDLALHPSVLMCRPQPESQARRNAQQHTVTEGFCLLLCRTASCPSPTSAAS